MKSAKLRLALVASLFVLWVGYLVYLSSTTSRQVLSRAQFLVSTLDVIAYIEDDNGQPSTKVRVEEVHWPASQQELVGKTIEVANLRHCRVPISSDSREWPIPGPGLYILPLIQRGEVYEVATIPRSPGFDGLSRQDCRIYAATPQNRRQLAVMPKPP